MLKFLKLKNKELMLCGLFVALIVVGSFIKIPIFGVPFTLQTLFVMLAAQLLGARISFWTIVCYIVTGLIGLPVFAGGGGISYVFTPTFGYIIGFLIAAPVIGYFSHKGSASFKKLLISNIAGIVVIYFFGILHFVLINALYLGQAVSALNVLVFCFAVFIPSDLIFCFLSAFLAVRLKKSIKM